MIDFYKELESFLTKENEEFLATFQEFKSEIDAQQAGVTQTVNTNKHTNVASSA